MKVENYGERGLDNGIVLKLLSAINTGSEKKQLESAAGISSKQLSRYLQELIKGGLVGYDASDGTTLKITEKGSRFLISYERVAASQTKHEPPKGLFDLE
ncbi:winged helix-turn-helix domain-containing protein [Nitrososphaera viennensis]|uniref:''Winged helix'' DNA-binding domain containing protein n=2 Tax=Nitrososphaera viennensis TaxID=1034015 RepID=A0A060HC79_9ARCH|nr:winged helix-turn-helix domain-containing protein [Nitrososphaera viennensis]AIC14369.1 ''Winged helix'' DNA-binding domain containing protein [Nitrososphaera viennensis EN76]UVS69354.1 winged helix-turn-helix domain-containing protein [Nitrososphaera viennensis]